MNGRITVAHRRNFFVIARGSVVLAFLILSAAQARGQVGAKTSGLPQLPAPTGTFAVGRLAFHWTDSTRTEPFATALSTHREVMVYAWYPAQPGAKGAPEGAYFPHLADIARAIGDSLTREEFGAALSPVRSGQVRSYVREAAPVSGAQRVFPVLIFSHGFGESSLTYSAQLTDLASHGYVVFGIEHPYDAFAVWFPGGRVVSFAATPSEVARKRPNGAVSYQIAQIPVRAADIRFVLDRVLQLAHAPMGSNPFAGRLELSRIGAFGHSLGGMAVASACRTDSRIRACANEDADEEGRPFDGGDAASPIKQPFLFFASGHSIYVSARTPLPSADGLAQMNLSRSQYDSIVTLYQRNQDAALAAMPGGSVRVDAESNTFTHRTFIDLKLLQATSDSGGAEQRHYMDLVRAYVRAFFDQTLLGRGDTVLDREMPLDSIVTVQRFSR